MAGMQTVSENFEKLLSEHERNPDRDPEDRAIWVTVEDLEEWLGEWDEDSYDAISILSDKFDIEEEQGGFFVSRLS